ncbi:hypothetical protein GG804_26025 [Sphingomonas histidinilytica]|uniref:hypothetical protein n=1 Tax=Rhizorhabdus histidinilytica TaxID=439228 RepID=UPI001AD9E7E0|nr:hypothetical protein [Rhizorhabdus histidinilytica]MBO9380228.1 hypothetical protein [Rhizorhabdus histidinilytica]
MATPPDAIQWPEPMDPADIVDWIADLSTMLELSKGETAQSYVIELSPEAIDAGLLIMTGDGRDHRLITGEEGWIDNTAILLWLKVDPASQADPLFDGSGTSFPVEVTFVTNSVPSRTRQRTYVLRVAQR